VKQMQQCHLYITNLFNLVYISGSKSCIEDRAKNRASDFGKEGIQ
jgi:hypothetical protein